MMYQEKYVRGITATSMNLEDEGERDDEPTWTRSQDPNVPTFARSGNEDTRNVASTSPRVCAAHFVGCRILRYFFHFQTFTS